MASESTLSRWLVRGAATTAAGVALVTDVGLDEHPTHSVVLGIVAVVVGALHRRLRRGALALTALPAVSAALAAQPVLHLVSKVGRPAAAAHDEHAPMVHVLASDAPTAGMQIVFPVVVLITIALAAHLFYLLLYAVHSPLIIVFATFGAPARVISAIRAGRQGSMLHWCGWVIRAARRGPPLAARHAAS